MTHTEPFNVIIVGFDGVLGSAPGALTISFAGVSWQRF